MGRYKLIVFTDPVPGREDEYNQWYNERHLQDVTAVPGMGSAQRFRLKTLTAGAFANRYLAIYDFDSDDPAAVMEEVSRRSGTDAMLISDALNDGGHNVGIFEACSDVVSSETS
jgi:hypothetical protein